MADVTEQLVAGSYVAVKREQFSTEIVRTYGGNTTRNANWSEPLASWDVTIPPGKRSGGAYTAAIALFEAVKGSALTFTFHDPVACSDVECCISEDSITITPMGNLAEVSFAVEEYR